VGVCIPGGDGNVDTPCRLGLVRMAAGAVVVAVARLAKSRRWGRWTLLARSGLCRKRPPAF